MNEQRSDRLVIALVIALAAGALIYVSILALPSAYRVEMWRWAEPGSLAATLEAASQHVDNANEVIGKVDKGLDVTTQALNKTGAIIGSLTVGVGAVIAVVRWLLGLRPPGPAPAILPTPPNGATCEQELAYARAQLESIGEKYGRLKERATVAVHQVRNQLNDAQRYVAALESRVARYAVARSILLVVALMTLTYFVAGMTQTAIRLTLASNDALPLIVNFLQSLLVLFTMPLIIWIAYHQFGKLRGIGDYRGAIFMIGFVGPVAGAVVYLLSQSPERLVQLVNGGRIAFPGTEGVPLLLYEFLFRVIVLPLVGIAVCSALELRYANSR